VQRIHVTIRPLNREDSVLYFPPEAFGPYRVLHQIGAGTLGPVFRAYEPGRDRLVAIKVFRLDLTPEQSTALVGHLDALVAADIHHPNIAAPISAGLESGAVYLAQEYAVGDSLDVVLRERGPMSIRDAEPLVASLARAIDYAASRGVTHGSLHLRDIVLAADAARITGFGIAAALTKIAAKLPTRPQYASPDGPSDAYALGAIAFETAAGKRVTPDNVKEFEAEHEGELHGALAAALQAVGAAGVSAVAPPRAQADAGSDFDLDIDRAVNVMAEPDPDPIDSFDQPASTPFPAAWSAQPPRALQTADDALPSRSRRWPIVAVFVGFAVLAALSVGFFLKSPAPVATGDPNAIVDETTVDLPATAPTPAPAPVPAPDATPRLPAPTPSRPASGAIAGAQKPARGSVLIRSSPADADVMMNGRARGKTPLTVRDLELGSYNIRVARDGYVTQERTLQLTARRPTASTTFSLREDKTAGRPGGVSVRSRPTGARVFVNERLVGSTPLAIPGLPAGPATVRIEMEGYRTWTTTVQVGAAEQRVAASLERK